MKRKAGFILMISLLFFVTTAATPGKVKKFPILRGPYLGQKPPGLTPALFAPGILSTGYHEDGGPAFSPDLKTIYYRIAQKPYPVIFFMVEAGGRWKPPQTATFSGCYADGAPFVSWDGNKLFFSSNRPLAGRGKPLDHEDVWYVRRIGNGWGQPVPLGKGVNTGYSEWKPSASGRGNLYFTSKREDNETGWKIYFSRFLNGEYAESIEFDKEINEKYNPICPCIARDESFLVFASAKEKDRRLDLFVTFRDKKGAWSVPRNLGIPVNSPGNDLFPVLSPDGLYLFFTSWRSSLEDHSSQRKTYDDFVKMYDSPANGWGGDIYWVDARVIEILKPKD